MILPTILIENAQTYRRRPAILDNDGIFTWADFQDRVARAAGTLRSLGLGRGDRFGLIMRNGFRQAELLWAGYWSGVIPVPLNWRLNPVELAEIIKDSGCRILAIENEFLPLLSSPALTLWTGAVLRVETSDGGKADYEACIAEASPLPMVPSAEDDDAILLYTGGTTGRSKGVRLSHGNIMANAWQIGLVSGIRMSDVYSHVAPMFHSADLHGTIAFVMGCSHVYVSHFSVDEVAACSERYSVTIAHWVPTMIKIILDATGGSHRCLSSIRKLFYGSSPMPVECVFALRRAFPHLELFHCYGLTETSPLLTILDDASSRAALESGDLSPLSSVGRPLPGVQLRVVDDGGAPQPAGQVGEVVARGPNVSKGYWNPTRQSASSGPDGWFPTGDIGYMDENGYLFLVDRKKDMIITGGENVYSGEVEAVLCMHPGVREAAVIGVPDERYGEALFAVIVPTQGFSLQISDLIVHCRAYIGGYKIPRRMAVVDALPRTALGKVQKARLRQQFGSELAGSPQ